MGSKMKNFNIMGGHWKIWFLRGVAKHQYIGGNCIKGGLGQFADLRGGPQGRGGVFEGGW